MSLHRLRALVAVCAMVAPLALRAQAGQCVIEYGKPGQVKDANNALAKTQLFAGKRDQILAATREALAKLQKDEAKVIAANPLGRAMVLGNVFSELAALPNPPGDSGSGKFLVPVTRASIGLSLDTSRIDLVSAADSMYDIVDASNPACRDETEPGRRKIYAVLVNDAVNLYNQQQVDSALALAIRGLSIYDGYKLAYIGHNLRGNALQSKDDLDGATAAFIRMTDLMKGDTAIVEERKSTMLNVVNLMLGHAEGMADDAKGAKVRSTISFLDTYLKEFPGDPKAEAALARAQIMSGDEQAAQRVFGAMAANPEKYSDTQLFEAAVNAARAEKPLEATSLFDAGLKKNPYSRDALFNIALTLQKQDKWQDADSYLRRLAKVDPENPEVYQVFALNYQGLARLAKEAAAKKPPESPEAKAYAAVNDSLLAYFKRYQEAPVKVTFTLWSHDGNRHVLAGSVENLSDAARSYNLSFEFLTPSGEVVTSKATSIEGLASKSTKGFRLEVEGAGIIAFRYAPLT